MRWLIVFGALLAGCVGEIRPGFELLGLETDSYLLEDTELRLSGDGWSCTTEIGELRHYTVDCPPHAPPWLSWSLKRSDGRITAAGLSDVSGASGRLGEDGLWVQYSRE
jgi:hypothetical protein